MLQECLLLSRMQKAASDCFLLIEACTGSARQPRALINTCRHTRPMPAQQACRQSAHSRLSVRHDVNLQVPVPMLSWADLRQAPPIDLDFAPRAFRRACCNKELQTDYVDLPNCTVDHHIARVYQRQVAAKQAQHLR